jgi:hypothetical protein
MGIDLPIKKCMLESPVVLWLGNVGPDGYCDVIRASGLMLHEAESRITVYVADRYVGPLRENIRRGIRELSLLITCIESYASYQFKGDFVSIHAASPQEEAETRHFVERFIEVSTRQGLHGEEIMRTFGTGPQTAITLQIREIFDQTPKPGTGNKISH